MPEKKNDVPAETGEIRRVGRSIYLHGEINDKTMADLQEALHRATDESLSQAALLRSIPAPPIQLFIQSGGGDLMAGIALHEAIKGNHVPVHTHVAAWCASAATLLHIAGKRRTMAATGLLLIHEFTDQFWGRASEVPDFQRNVTSTMKVLREIYKAGSRMTDAELDRLFEGDLSLRAKEAKRRGLIDAISWTP